jgi:hypothetical protein
MVVSVKEGKRLFLKNQENSVKKLKELSNVVDIVDSDNGLSPRSRVAYGVKNTVVVKDRDELLNKKEEESERKNSEKEVVDLEEEIESLGLKVPHDLATTEDDNVVYNDGQQDRGGSREGETSVLRKDKSVGIIVGELDRQEGNDIPKVETKRSIHGGNGELERRRHR